MAKSDNPFRWFDSSPEVIRTVVMRFVRFPLSLRQVEDLLVERGTDIRHETVRLLWNRFDPMFVVAISIHSIKSERYLTDELMVRNHRLADPRNRGRKGRLRCLKRPHSRRARPWRERRPAPGSASGFFGSSMF